MQGGITIMTQLANGINNALSFRLDVRSPTKLISGLPGEQQLRVNEDHRPHPRTHIG